MREAWGAAGFKVDLGWDGLNDQHGGIDNRPVIWI